MFHTQGLPELIQLNGSEIRRLRQEKFPEHTMEKFAAELHISKMTLVRWEKPLSRTYRSMAEALAKHLGVELKDIAKQQN